LYVIAGWPDNARLVQEESLGTKIHILGILNEVVKILNAFLNRLLRFFGKQTRSHILAFSIAVVILLGVLDYFTGPDLSFAIFYLAPIFLVAWYHGKADAIAIATASIAAMMTADFMAGMKYPHPMIHLWNEIAKLGVFSLIVFLIVELRNRLATERTLSRIDHLTQIANRRAFHESLGTEIIRVRRHPSALTVAYIDIDRFKAMNDQYGHEVGDQILKVTATTIKVNLRAIDTVARLGGDEFAILLPHTNSETSRFVMHKVRNGLADAARSENWEISFSVGCVTFVRPPQDIDEVIRKADELMYSCKKSGDSLIRHEIIVGSSVPPINSALPSALNQ
jgi:diguanylate cyclase (GGDEF)-like protein